MINEQKKTVKKNIILRKYNVAPNPGEEINTK